MNKKKFLENLKDFYKGCGEGLKIWVPIVAIVSLIVSALGARE